MRRTTVVTDNPSAAQGLIVIENEVNFSAALMGNHLTIAAAHAGARRRLVRAPL